MELDEAFEFAVILAWEDLMKVSKPSLVRVEYQGEPGTSLDYVSVWSAKEGGNQDLVCDYWTWTSPAHPGGVRFRNGHTSDRLARTLDFIMTNQDQFTRRADACRDGLVLIYPPVEDDRVEAAIWIRRVRGSCSNLSEAVDERVPAMTSVANRLQGSAPPSSWPDAEPITSLRFGESST